MQSLFVGAFIAGLVLNVYFMIRGAERWRASDAAARLDAFGRELGLGRISLRTPVAASLTSAFGLTGYLLHRYTDLASWVTILLAIVGAAIGVTSAVVLIKRWAVPAAERDLPDARYLLQGQLAHVTRAIPYEGDGLISYEIDGTRFTAVARTLDGAPLDAESDVVIDRVEDGVAYVEDWTLVEQRL